MTTQTVNREAMEKWIAALRSGEYTQYRGRLRNAENPQQMCCLGVACDVAPVGQWIDSTSTTYTDGVENRVGGMPDSVTAYYGVGSDINTKCIDWNDQDQLTFAEIADKLEEAYL